MLFLTTMKFFLSSVSFKALMVLKGFRNRERLGTKAKLRTWTLESSPKSAGPLSVVCCREEIGQFITDRGSRRPYKFSMFKSCAFFLNTRNCYPENLNFAKPRDHFVKICMGKEGSKVDINPQ